MSRRETITAKVLKFLNYASCNTLSTKFHSVKNLIKH